MKLNIKKSLRLGLGLDLIDRNLYHSFFLFVWGLTFYSKKFRSYGDVTSTGERLQILTYARHSQPLSSEGSLACHNDCVLSVYDGHLRGPHTHTYCRAFGSGAVTTCFYSYVLRLLRMGFEHPTFRLRVESSDPLRHCRGFVTFYTRFFSK